MGGRNIVPMIKPKRQSRTLRFNIGLMIAFGLLEAGAILFQAALPEITYAVIIAVSGIGNIILRFFTVGPIR